MMPTVTGRRGASAAVLPVSGAALAAATWIGGQRAWAVGLVACYAIAAVAVYLWSGRDSDLAAIMRAGGDERRRRLDRDATAVAGLVMLLAAVGGAVVQAARDGGNRGGTPVPTGSCAQWAGSPTQRR